MRRDLRDALRALRRAPAFSIVAVLSLAIAIGSATAVFSVADAVLVRGMPYPDADRLVTVYEQRDDKTPRLPSYPTVKEWQAQLGAANASVKDAIDGVAYIRGDGISLPGPDGPETQAAAYVTPGFFALTGIQPYLGRAFSSDDGGANASRVCIISYAYFMRQFGGDRGALGHTISIDSIPATIIGVMPRGFAYPNFGGGGAWYPPALWQPIAAYEAKHPEFATRPLHVDSRTLLRVHAGADTVRAIAAMATLEQRLAIEHPAEQGHWTSVTLNPLSRELFGNLGSTLMLIAGAVAFVLLLACANVANLLLVRASVRGRELAVRAALGAGAWRLARHLLAEAVVIAAAAGALGVALSVGLLAALRPYAALRLPFATDFSLDGHAVWFTIGITAATTLLIAALPALRASRDDVAARLRGGAISVAGSATERRARNSLVVLQLTLAIAVLIGAGLLVQSLRRISDVDLGFDPNGVISFTIAPPRGRYTTPAEAAALYQRILDATRAVPSVELSAAAGGALLPTKVETDALRGTTAPPVAIFHPVSADFFTVMHISLAAGRGFTLDDMRSPNGFLVTQGLAKKLWPAGSALGQRITVYRASQARADFGQPVTLPVVGVVADFHEHGAEADPPDEVFLPYTLEVWPWMNFVVRSTRPEQSLAAIKRAVESIEPAIDFRGKPSIEKTGLAAVEATPRAFVASLMVGFAGCALLLAAIGLYGIIAYGVAQRTRELGVRVALGASRRQIVALIMGQAGRLVAAGVAAGLVTAFATTKLLRAMLFQTTPTDAATFVVVPIMLAAVAAAASIAPALRAMRTDPIIAIRAE